jgi:phosphoglycerate dehydrogenase-like enzyme
MKSVVTWVGLLLVCLLAAADRAPAAESVIERYQLEEDKQPVRERPGWRKPTRILIAASAAPFLDRLKAAAPGVEFIVAQGGRVSEQAAGVDAVIGMCTPELLAAGRSIRWIQLVTAGVERCVSIPAVRERDILITNMQRIGGPIIAEHALAMMLALTRGLDVYVRAQDRHEWNRAMLPAGRMTVLQGKTLLVVGLGGIGSEVAERAHALGMKVVAIRASGRHGPSFVSYVGLPDELDKLAAQADFVVNTAPLTPQTRGMFDAGFFSRIKSGAYFINVARGASVDTSALIEALRSGKIAGAGLDVTDPEPPPPNHPLWSAPNVIITPHVANDSDLGYGAQLEVVAENLRRYTAGERMLSVVDVERGY